MQEERGAEAQAGGRSANDTPQAMSAASTARFLPVAFLAVVIACVVLPLLETLHPFFGTIVQPVDEHRTANPFPSPGLLLRSSGDFADGLNKWFDDHVGFRDLFIRTKNQIDYSVFSTSRKVYVGSDGWLFERDYPGLPLERLDATRFEAVQAGFLNLARQLQEKGIQLLVVGYPDKSRVYPELVPAAEPLLPPGGNYDKLRQFLSRQSTLTFIDVEEILRRERSTTTDALYYKTDLHANEMGQLPIVKEIIAQIARAEGRPYIGWNEKFERTAEVWGPGGEARFLSPLVPVLETTTYFKGRYVFGEKESDGHWNIPDPSVFNRTDDGSGPPFAWEFHSRAELCNERLPATVILGNSFSDVYWTLGLHRYFCSIRRTRIPINRLEQSLKTIPDGTKYFIFQYYAPFLPSAAPPVH